MNKRFKIVMTALSLAAALSFAAGELYAQQGKGRGGKGQGGKGCCNYENGSGMKGNHFNRMQENLGLTDAQVEKIFKIKTEYRQKMFDNRKNPDKVSAVRNELHKEIEKVLTKEQKEKWINMRGKGRGKNCN